MQGTELMMERAASLADNHPLATNRAGARKGLQGRRVDPNSAATLACSARVERSGLGSVSTVPVWITPA